MSAHEPFAGVNHILCPTDLSVRSQKTLAYAQQIASAVNARLTAFHSAVDSWLHPTDALSREEIDEIEATIRADVLACGGAIDLDVIVESSTDPATAIPRLVRSLDVDLVIMKARPGMLSALHFGSIVERVISAVDCPVMLIPSRSLAENTTTAVRPAFQRILFDYDFSQATDELFHLANSLSQNYEAKLHVITVLEPAPSDLETAAITASDALLETIVRRKLNSVVRAEGLSTDDVFTAVEWGRHSDRVLKYASDHKIDLICTTLPDPGFYFQKVYRAYLGQLLAGAQCPILVKQCV